MLVSNFNEIGDMGRQHFRYVLSRGSDDCFSNVLNVRGRCPHNNTDQPKPDFWFGLHIYNENQMFRLKGLEIKDKGVEYFIPVNLECIGTIREDTLHFHGCP